MHKKPAVKGAIDSFTRCRHYHSEVDIVALKLPCCHIYYSCYECHEELADHPAQRWEIEDVDTKAVLCGRCGVMLSIREYLTCKATCPSCRAAFNPRCERHYGLYFSQNVMMKYL